MEKFEYKKIYSEYCDHYFDGWESIDNKSEDEQISVLSEPLDEVIDVEKTMFVKRGNYNYHPKNKHELCDIIEEKLLENQLTPNLLDIDVSKIVDFSSLFLPNYWYDRSNGKICLWHMESLDLSTWNTKNCHIMEHMFFGCNALEELKGLEYWNVRNVHCMHAMFYDCRSLRYLKVDGWFKEKCRHVDTYHMFINCKQSIIPLWYVETPY